jgi:arabinosyltransferase C
VSSEVTDRAGGGDGEPAGPGRPVPPGIPADQRTVRLPVPAGQVPRAVTLGTGACALLAILFAVLLPLAPVKVNVPTVQWPLDPAAPKSTLLHVTAYRPAALDLHFSCRTARAAAETNYSATVLSTVNPVLPEVADLGLIARVVTKPGDRLELTVDAVGARLLKEPLPAGDCVYRVQGDPVAGLALSRDGVPLARGPAGVLPDVDVLATSVAALPDATPDDLGVTLRLDDEFATSPTGLKFLLIVGLVAALAGTGAGLWRLDRAVSRVPTVWRVPRPHLADLAVLAAMGTWLILAPATDDDGYYAAMATNSLHTGYVGNYYQLYDQSFVPIAWFYQALGWWQTVAGTAPVAQRGLALAAGLATWFVLRAFLSSAARETTRELEARDPMPSAGWLVRTATPAVAAVAFLAWWLPQDMGVRPEGAVALLAVCALYGVWVAVRRRRLLAAYGAFAAAGLALATHTTGFVGLAPLLAGAGGLWTLVRAGGPLTTGIRTLALIAGGTTASLAGFADGSLRDFLRAQQIFLDIQPREYWYTEILRWNFLLGEGAMGNYAKRVAVLVALVAVLWFLGLSAASRVLAQHGRGAPLPGALRLAGWTLICAFGLLWLTPSKWTHHFGAMAGVGPVFLTLLLVAMVPIARAVFGSERVPVPVLLGAAGSMLVVLALAGHGNNTWPYAWLNGFADKGTRPDVGPFVFGSIVSWAAVLAGCVAVGWLWTRRRGDHLDRAGTWGPATLRAVALFVVAGLLLNVVYLLGSFAVAARNTAAPELPNQPWSLWGASLADPLATRCGALDAVSVYDPFTAQPLDEVKGLDPDVELRPADPRAVSLRAGELGPTAQAAAQLAGFAELPGLSALTGLAGPAVLPSLAAANRSGRPSALESAIAAALGAPGGDVSDSGPTTLPDPQGDDDEDTDDVPEPSAATGRRAADTGFERAGGYYLGYQPAVQLGTGAATTVWGSLLDVDGKSPDRNTGEMRSPWYKLPPGLGADRALAVLLAGSPNSGNSLTAEYAAVQGGRLVRVEPGAQDTGETGTQSRNQTAAQRDPSQRDTGQLDPTAGRTGDLDDGGRDPRWRSVLLETPPQAQFVRLHAVDDSAGSGGWLAFAAPAVQKLVPLRTMLDEMPARGPRAEDRPVALAWQIAFGYPCLRQPRIVDGVSEPPAAAVLWANNPFDGTRDGTWQAFRGGIHGQVLRSQSPLQLAARIKGMPTERRTEVLLFDSPLATDAYRLSTDDRVTSGWAQPVPTATRTSNELERCVQRAAAAGTLAAAARCVPKPVP